MTNEELIRDFRKGTLQWYPFEKDSDVLFVGDKTDALFEMLSGKNLQMDVCAAVDVSSDEEAQPSTDDKKCYDYIIAIESLEVIRDYAGAIRKLAGILKPEGHLLLGVNNRLGIRYFAGDRDIYTDRSFDGIENYRRAYTKAEDTFLGRGYDKATAIDMLGDAGLKQQCFSVFPDFNNVQMILRDDYTPNEEMLIRILPTYHYAKTVFFEEEYVYDDLLKNGMLHSMTNCLLFDATPLSVGPSNAKTDILQITSSMGREKADAFVTVIHEGGEKRGFVEKIPAYPEGMKKIEQMTKITEDLKAAGVPVIEGAAVDGAYRTPYIDAKMAQVYFAELAARDEELFLKKLDEFVGLILKSSEHAAENVGDGEGVTLKYAYPDMMPLNCFYKDDKFVFFDQEFVLHDYPANAIIIRVIMCLGAAIAKCKTITYDDVIKRYGLDQNRAKWNEMQWKFLSELRREKEMASYFASVRHDVNRVNSNRQRMNFSADDYQKIFVDVLRDLEYKKVILFGTGRFAKQFAELYGEDYEIAAVVDNSEGRWGQDFFGHEIKSPACIKDFELGTYRVIICIKNYLSVVRQLDEMKIAEYGIYDPNQHYVRTLRAASHNPAGTSDAKSHERKKYHIGYIAGVFDLFHVGHLEKFKLAKEQCDHLIVGLVSDEGVRKYKKTEPFVSFEDRKAILEACRYVDEVVKIPLDHGGSRDMWKLYGFDVQFSGSDYVNDPWWQSEKEFLNQHGVDIVFFPYTESVSSSKLKELIDRKLL